MVGATGIPRSRLTAWLWGNRDDFAALVLAKSTACRTFLAVGG